MAYIVLHSGQTSAEMCKFAIILSVASVSFLYHPNFFGIVAKTGTERNETNGTNGMAKKSIHCGILLKSVIHLSEAPHAVPYYLSFVRSANLFVKFLQRPKYFNSKIFSIYGSYKNHQWVATRVVCKLITASQWVGSQV